MILRDLAFFKSTRFLAFGLFAITLTLYLFTLAPTIALEDSAEFVTAAVTLGVPHPPGFPLYVLLGKLFTFLPIGELAWRVNFMSAFWGAATVALLFVLVHRLVHHRGIAACAALLVGCSELFWSQSVVAEVYTLNAFFVVLQLLLLISWARNPARRGLGWFAFVYGLSLANHTMLVLCAPAYVFFILLVQPQLLWRFKSLLRLFRLWLTGLVPVYVWMAIRAIQTPALNSLQQVSVASVLGHITRTAYNDFLPSTALFSKFGLVISFVAELGNQFFYPSVLLAFFGLAWLMRRRFPLAVLTLGVLLGNSLLIIYLRRFGWGMGIHYTYRVYYLPSLLMVMVWFGVALAAGRRVLLRVLEHHPRVRSGAQAAFGALLFVLPLSFAIGNYRVVDMSRFRMGDDYGRAILATLPPNAIYFFSYDSSLHGDTEIFNLQYLRVVEGLRPDVRIVNEQRTFYKEVQFTIPPEHWDLTLEQRRSRFLELLMASAGERPVYTNFVVSQRDSEKKFFSRSTGLTYRVYPSFEEARQAQPEPAPAVLRNTDQYLVSGAFVPSDLLAHQAYGLAAYYLTAGLIDRSNQQLLEAIRLSNFPSHEHERFLRYRAEWLGRATSTPVH